MINDGGWWGHALGVALLLMRWYCSFPIQSISDMSMFMLSVWSNIQAEIINKKNKQQYNILDIFSLFNHIYPIYFYPGSLCQDQKRLPISSRWHRICSRLAVMVVAPETKSLSKAECTNPPGAVGMPAMILPRCSMYGIFTYIYPKNGPNVG